MTAYSLDNGVSYSQAEIDCAVGLSTNDCHKLVGLKGSDSSPLETVVNNWMICNAPLSTADCSNVYDLTWNGTLLGPVAIVGTTRGGGSSGGGTAGLAGIFYVSYAERIVIRKHD